MLKEKFSKHEAIALGRLYPTRSYSDRYHCQSTHSGWLCTRPPNHDELHAAYGLDDSKPIAVWDDED